MYCHRPAPVWDFAQRAVTHDRGIRFEHGGDGAHPPEVGSTGARAQIMTLRT
jgi:hypothetical protein